MLKVRFDIMNEQLVEQNQSGHFISQFQGLKGTNTQTLRNLTEQSARKGAHTFIGEYVFLTHD